VSPADELAAARELCRRITHQRGANFSVGFRLLPPPKREAVYAAYAFCRYADDVADDHDGPGEVPPLHALDLWEQELERTYAGRPGHPIGLALARALERFAIPRQAFSELIAGCRDDLAGRRYETFDDLLGYCALVAEPIGRICIAIFGATDPRAHLLGRSLSRALQLTNVLRDVGEDARQGRIYLPLQELRGQGVTLQALAAAQGGEAFDRLMRPNIARAADFFAQATPLAEAVEPDARATTRLMAAVYREILRRIELDPQQVLVHTVTLSETDKQQLVARYGAAAVHMEKAAD
jgi:phytoene synthase